LVLRREARRWLSVGSADGPTPRPLGATPLRLLEPAAQLRPRSSVRPIPCDGLGQCGRARGPRIAILRERAATLATAATSAQPAATRCGASSRARRRPGVHGSSRSRLQWRSRRTAMRLPHLEQGFVNSHPAPVKSAIPNWSAASTKAPAPALRSVDVVGGSRRSHRPDALNDDLRALGQSPRPIPCAEKRPASR